MSVVVQTGNVVSWFGTLDSASPFGHDLSVVVSAGSDLALAVEVTCPNQQFPADLVVSYGGTPLTKLFSQSTLAQYGSSALFYLLNPPVGTATLRVNVSAWRGQDAGVTAIPMTGVHQTTAFGTPVELASSTLSSPASIAVTSAEVCLMMAGVYGVGALAGDAGQTDTLSCLFPWSGNVRGLHSYKAGSLTSMGFSWSTGGTNQGRSVAIPVLASVSGTAPSITTNPSNQSVAAGATATFTAAASGTPTPTYQWQRNPGGAGSFADISGAVSASYTTPATTVSGGSANNGDTYRCVATNASGSATTTAATLTVSAANAPPTFPGPSITDMTLGLGAAMSPVNVASKFSDTDALTFSAVGSWPPGLAISSAGVISGTPTTAGAYTNLKVRATDTGSQTVDSNTFSITISAAAGTLNFQASGMEFGRRSGLGISTFSLDASSGYRYTVHPNALTLGAAVYTSGVVSTDATGKLPNLTDSALVTGTTYRVHAIRQADGEAATFRMVAA